jgi:Helix-destabilising protein
MIVIEIRDGAVRERHAEVRGRDSVFREQEGWCQLNGETRKIRVPLGRELAPYVPGKYQVDDASFGVNQWGDLTVTRLVLRGIAASASVRQAGG